MSSKLFGNIFFDATKINVWQMLFEATPQHDTTAIVVFCNQSADPAKISLAYARVNPTLMPLVESEIIMLDKTLEPNETFHFPALAVEQSMNIQVRSDVEGVSVLAHGYQDPT